MTPTQQVIFLIPAYNEARTIVGVLERCLPLAKEILVVDDGSEDQSGKLLEAFMALHPQLTVLTHKKNVGMSGALLSGFVYLVTLRMKGRVQADDIVVMLDADGQHRPEEGGPASAEFVRRGVDILLGRRDLSGYPLAKRIGNPVLSLWASWLSGHRYHDVECGFRVLRVSTIEAMLPYFSGRHYGCAQEIAIISARLGLLVDNTFPTTVTYYRQGARLRDGFNNLYVGFMAWLRVRRGRRRSLEAIRASCAFEVSSGRSAKQHQVPT